MKDYILLVEDNADDEALTLRALRRALASRALVMRFASTLLLRWDGEGELGEGVGGGGGGERARRRLRGAEGSRRLSHLGARGLHLSLSVVPGVVRDGADAADVYMRVCRILPTRWWCITGWRRI